MSWTKAQEKVITENNKSLLVSAAAGSGKTSVLVEKVTRLLAEGHDLSRMLIVTFTNAAAGEMKQRIADSLDSSYVRNSHISTFHKFAIDVIQQYYQIIGINPSLTICDEYRKSILQNEALDEMFEDLFNSDDEDFIYFLNHYCTSKSNQNVKDMITYLNTFLESLPNSEEYLEKIKNGNAFDENSYAEYAREYIEESLKLIISDLEKAKDLLLNPGVSAASPMPKLAAKVSEDIDGLKAVLESINANGIDACSALGEFKFQRMAKTNDEKPSFELIGDKFDILRKSATDEMKSLVKDFGSISLEKLKAEKEAVKKPLNILASLTEDFRNRYQSKKREHNLVDFADIEHYALKILDNKDVCAELRDSFDYIFVDEYQDSNSVQDELISRISKEDNVFMVGDVKQSIYKFRLAEPELFLGRYHLYKKANLKNAEAIDLNSNFRSKKPVIDFINFLFSRLMTMETVGLEYNEDVQLNEGSPYEGDKLYQPKLHIISTTADDGEVVDSEIEDLKAAELEALDAVRTIKEYHGKPIFDAKKGVDRPLEYKDMVILLRSTKTKGEVFYKALEDAGIPVYLERGEGYFDTPEIQVLLNLLRIIDNFRQDIALISVLHFPSFGFMADELAKIRIFAKEHDMADVSFADAFKYYEQNAAGALKDRCTAFLKQIDLYRTEVKAMPLSDFIWSILTDSGIGNYARALPSGAQRYANLKALVERAESFELQNGGGLFSFVSYIELISKDDRAVETGQVTVLKEGADTVRIMTIHKSKGLEFPFVLLAGLSSTFRSSKSKLHLGLHKALGASIRLTEPLKGLYTDPFSLNIINNKRTEEDFAEIIRVLYVALTRAKDILVLSAVVKDANAWMSQRTLRNSAKDCKNYLDMVGSSFNVSDIEVVSLADLTKSVEPVGFAKTILDSLDKGFNVKEEDLPISLSELKSRIEFDYSPKAEDLLKHKYSVSEITALKHEVPTDVTGGEKDYPVPMFIKGKVSLGAAAKGTAYHSVMEHLDFANGPKDIESISKLIDDLKQRMLMSEDEANAVDPERIAAFFKSDIGKRASGAKTLYKEKPFILKTMFEGREVLVQGTIDCFFEEDGKWVLVDYKSNYIDKSKLEEEKERLTNSYIPQLELYKEALEKITGKTVKEAVLYLFGINDIIKVC